MKQRVQFIGAWVLAAFVLGLWSGRIDFGATLGAVRHLAVAPMALGVSLLIAAYLVRAARWRIWERCLTYRDSLRFILVGFMGNNVLPARRGEVMRARYAAAKTGRGVSPTAGLASIAAERALDGLVLGVAGLAATGLITLPPQLRFALLGVSLLFATLGVAVGLGFSTTGGSAGLWPPPTGGFPAT